MARTFEMVDLVELPTLDVQSAYSLGQEILTQAAQEPKKLPAGIERGRGRLQDRLGLLHQAQQQRLGSPSADGRRSRVADEGEDAAFAILQGWLSALARLPVSFPEAAQAQGVLDVLFEDGLRFTQLPYKKEWAEADARLARLHRDGLDTVIESLGGRSILRNLRQAHDEYGRALGITQPSPEADPTSMREPLQAVRGALRSYVLQVTSHADSEDSEAAQALAERLLTPLRSFAPRKPARPDAPDAPPTPDAPPAPAAPPAPGT